MMEGGRSSSQAEHEELLEQNQGSTSAAGPSSSRSALITNAPNIPETFFCCFICYGTVKKPRLCPKCAHLCCYDCLKRWYSMPAISATGTPSRTKNSQCPHCRYTLPVEQYIKCPWVEELLQQLQKDTDKDVADQCEIHRERKSVYCTTCTDCICYVCALFSGQHADHVFSPIDELYRTHVSVIRNEMEKLLVRLRTLEAKRKILDKGARKVRAAREESMRDAHSIVEQMRCDIAKQMTEKLVELHGDRGLVVFELEIVSQAVRRMQEIINKAPKSELITKTPGLVSQAKDISARELPAVELLQGIEYKSSVVPNYAGDVFIIRDFSKLSDAGEPVFSESVFSGGLKWRIKVYPNYKPGGLAENDAWLSVFLELNEAPSGSHFHEYRIELIHVGLLADRSDKNPEKNVCKEFTSNFEVGECWGSNRFYQREHLARDGFLNDGIVMLKYDVRPPNYAKAYHYAQWYLQQKETAHKQLTEENFKLREFIGQMSMNRFTSAERSRFAVASVLSEMNPLQISSTPLPNADAFAAGLEAMQLRESNLLQGNSTSSYISASSSQDSPPARRIASAPAAIPAENLDAIYDVPRPITQSGEPRQFFNFEVPLSAEPVSDSISEFGSVIHLDGSESRSNTHSRLFSRHLVPSDGLSSYVFTGRGSPFSTEDEDSEATEDELSGRYD